MFPLMFGFSCCRIFITNIRQQLSWSKSQRSVWHVRHSLHSLSSSKPECNIYHEASDQCDPKCRYIIGWCNMASGKYHGWDGTSGGDTVRNQLGWIILSGQLAVTVNNGALTLSHYPFNHTTYDRQTDQSETAQLTCSQCFLRQGLISKRVQIQHFVLASSEWKKNWKDQKPPLASILTAN